MLNVELKKVDKVSKNGTSYVSNEYRFYCNECKLSLTIVDFNNVILVDELIENVKIEITSDKRVLVVADNFEYQVPWNYKTSLLRLYNHCLSCEVERSVND